MLPNRKSKMRRSRPITSLAGAAPIPLSALDVGLRPRRRPRIAAGMYVGTDREGRDRRVSDSRRREQPWYVLSPGGNQITGAASTSDPVRGSSRPVAPEGRTP
jgi:hypothetical protein